MILKQFYLGCLAHASYLVGDARSKTAAVVDPQRDVDQYIEEARRRGLKIRYVILTHFHADFVSGHLELRDLAGAEILLGRRARADYEFTPLKDGQAVDLGRVRLKALETPGHTPEAISLLVYDLDKDAQKPHAVLTGDTLFIGDVGRPDLMASEGVTAEELAGMLYDSLRKKLLTLPDKTLVYPAHGAGSMCGKNISSETVSTLGEQRRCNYALKPMTKKEFVRLVTADQPEAPAYFSYDAALNRSLRPTLRKTLQKSLKPLGPAQVLKLRKAGAYALDVRDPADFALAHLAGSVNIGLGGKFATWAGTVLDRSRRIVIVAEPGWEEEAAMRLGRIGFDQVAGYLKGGMQALEDRPELVAETERVSAQALAEELASGKPPLVLDVRTQGERQAQRIPRSLHIPLNQLPRRLKEVPRGQRLVIHCASGYRSMIAASLLERGGWRDAADLVGGINAWAKASPGLELAA